MWRVDSDSVLVSVKLVLDDSGRDEFDKPRLPIVVVELVLLLSIPSCILLA